MMKKFTVAIFALAALAVAQKPDTRWYTAAKPNAVVFTISTADQLAGLAQIVNGTWGGKPARYDFSGKTVKLGGSIDLSRYDNWVPIGGGSGVWTPCESCYGVYGEGTPFSGRFDGGGHVISNLTINRPDSSHQGLFGYVGGGRVENLGLDNVNISGRDFVGGVAGNIFSGSVDYCYSAGVVSGGNNVGGIVGGGCLKSVIANSYSAVSVSGGECVGGIAGTIAANCSVISCYSTGAVSGADKVGGVAGEAWVGGSVVANCAALNPAVAGTGASVGRVIGKIEDDDTLSNNAANIKMKNRAGGALWPNKGGKELDGADMAPSSIKADGTLGGRFDRADGWSIAPGKLPGLRGKAMDLPKHLK